MFFYKKIFFLSILFFLFISSIFFIAQPASGQTNPFVGKWGYTVLGHSAGTPTPWYTWKTEAGTIVFNENGTAQLTYKESADSCPNENYCKITETTSHTYTYNASTRTALIDGEIKLFLSDDGTVAIADGTTIPGEQLLIIAVKLDTNYTYSSADISGAYYTGAYEYDSQGNPPPNGLGQYRLWAMVATANNNNFDISGSINSDGNVFSIPQGQTQPFSVNADGTMLIGSQQTGYSTGYIGNQGKISIFSNPIGGVQTDFASYISLKKQDKTYSQTDVSGNWTIATFEENSGNFFATEFGLLTCNDSGYCSGNLKKKLHDGSLSTYAVPGIRLIASADGALNSFLLTQAQPHYSGAIGNNGNTMLLLMNRNSDNKNNRVLGIAVKRNTVANTITVSGTVQDQNGNFTSGIKVELAEDPTVYTYTNSNGEYTLTGVPSETDFTLRFTKDGAIPTYTPVFNFTADTTLTRYFKLMPTGWNTNIGNFPIITGKVREDSPNWDTVTLSGVTVTSSKGTVEYKADNQPFGGTSTYANGQWFIRDASPGDVITASATKEGTTIPQRRYKAFSDGVTSGSLFAKPNEGTIWVSRIVKDKNGNPISGAQVAKVTNDTTGATGSPSTTTNTDGSFTLSGLPSGSLFYLKTTKDGFVPDYTLYNSTNNYNMLSGRPLGLWTQQDLTSAGVTTGKGVIKGVVINDNDPNESPLEGVTITYTSSKGNTNYEVKYYNPQVGFTLVGPTYINGNFFITNVEDGDTVTINATKSGWTFAPRAYITHGDSTVSALIRGTPQAAPTISYTGNVVDLNGNPVQGALVMKAGDPSISTTTDGNGNFVLNGLPSGSPFHIKITKDGYIPVYSANFNSTTNITASRPFKLFTQQELAQRGWPGTTLIINGVVALKDNPQQTLSGAIVTATGQSGNQYPVTYETVEEQFGGTTTSSNGRYYVFNVYPNDTVTVNATLQGYTFEQRVFTVHIDGMNEGSLFGVSSGGGTGITSISLSSGWNFISFPKLPSLSTGIETALAGILSNVRVVWGYDNVSKTWKRYKPDAQGNTLSTVEIGKGYWIYMNGAGSIDLSSWTATSNTINLTQGWNLIGFSGTEGTSVSNALSSISGSWDIMWSWQNGQWYIATPTSGIPSLPFMTITNMNQGRAYWIKMEEARQWQQ